MNLEQIQEVKENLNLDGTLDNTIDDVKSELDKAQEGLNQVIERAQQESFKDVEELFQKTTKPQEMESKREDSSKDSNDISTQNTPTQTERL